MKILGKADAQEEIERLRKVVSELEDIDIENHAAEIKQLRETNKKLEAKVFRLQDTISRIRFPDTTGR